MVLLETIRVAAPTYYLGYLINGELDELDAIDVCDISDYVQNLSREFDEPVTIDFSYVGEDSYFGYNDFNNCMGDISDVDVLIFKK